MKQFQVTGMSCAACSARVEKAVSAVEGVTSCSVSLLTNSMGVEGTASDAAVIAAVEAAGYGASPKQAAREVSVQNYAAEEEALKDHETPRLKKRLLASVAFLAVLMYVSMGHGMAGWPLPAWFEGNPVAVGLLQLLLTTVIMVINQRFFISGFTSLLHRAPNMDTLVALGSSAAYGYSVYGLFAMTRAVADGRMEQAHALLHDFYFESAAMILTLITVGKMLEAHSKGKTTDALRSLMKMAPKTAHVLQGDQEVEVPIEDVRAGDLFVVRPGENIPVDGVLEEGAGAVDESVLTGESLPVDKKAGDRLSAGTINRSGFLRCRATRVGEDTTLSQIIRMVSDAAATKAPIAKVADRVSGIFVPAVIGLAVVTLLVWLLVGYDIGFAMARAISVLVISCPCALGLATPVAIMVGNGVGARQGILFKTAVSLEETGKVETVVLDKTGTITHGKPVVTDLWGPDEKELLALAMALEVGSEHPLAQAVVAYAQEKKTERRDITEFAALPGYGVQGKWNGQVIYGGNVALIQKHMTLSAEALDRVDQWSRQGKTPLIFGAGGQLLGVIAVADTIKEDSAEAIAQLKGMGIHVVMLTGDNEKTARAMGDQAGVDEVIAGVLPDGKESVIRRLKEQGKVAMVGDGINDAPALMRADMGIAIGAGTDVAIDAADVVLMKSRLLDVPAALRLSRATRRNIKQNLFWAFFYNMIGIPLAAGVWYPLFGWLLQPMFGAAAMSLSSFCVVSNALRLNLCRVHDASKDRKVKKNKIKEKEVQNMTKTIKIEGMMCGHCEAHVKKALEAIPEVQEAVVSHVEGTAVVTLTAPVDEAVLTKAVTDEDYTVISVQ